jgi:hypothetical protein
MAPPRKGGRNMRHVNVYDQLNDLVTQFEPSDGTFVEERSHGMIETELACEILEVIVAETIDSDNIRKVIVP